MDRTGDSRMSLAMKRLQNIGWLALVFLVAILLYPLSLNVAAVHSDLVSVDGKIRDTKREISFLQAELRTRASMRQLEEWNNVLYGYKPPSAEQFIEGESALANLSGKLPIARPVLVSVSSSDGERPAGIIGSPFAKMEDVNADKPAKPALAILTEPTEKSPIQSKANSDSAEPSAHNRTEKLARLDEKLLSDGVMKDIQKASESERKRK
jgi:hypothetical protein